MPRSCLGQRIPDRRPCIQRPAAAAGGRAQSGGTSSTSPPSGEATGYDLNRDAFARLIWSTASPRWNFDDATFARTASALRQSRSRRHRDPQLSMETGARARPTRVRRSRKTARRAASDRSADDHDGRRRERGPASRRSGCTGSSSSDPTSIGSSTAVSATTFRKRRRRHSRQPSWTSIGSPPAVRRRRRRRMSAEATQHPNGSARGPFRSLGASAVRPGGAAGGGSTRLVREGDGVARNRSR